IALGAPALHEIRAALPAHPLPLFLALPEPDRPDGTAARAGEAVAAPAARGGPGLDVAASRGIRAGPAGFAPALGAGVPRAPPARGSTGSPRARRPCWWAASTATYTRR